MPAPTPDSQALRDRAATLRTLARSISSSKTVGVHQHAGEDVWLGPTAFQCHADLIAIGRRLVGAADDLVARARILEQRAQVLESMAPVG